MQLLISRFRYVHAQRLRTLSDAKSNRQGIPEDAPEQLVPLMKGAWLGKPAANAQRKRRFFQLSTDGSTLRWAWDKYILLYYVEVSSWERFLTSPWINLLLLPPSNPMFTRARGFWSFSKESGTQHHFGATLARQATGPIEGQ